MNQSNRLYHCVRCHRQVIICRYCDRGNRYCSGDCSSLTRQANVKRAGRRYQLTSQGRRLHAARQMRYQRRQNKKVTHQGSPAEPINPDFSEGKIKHHKDISEGYYCHFCGNNQSMMLRRQFLRHQIREIHAVSDVLAQGP